MIRLVLSCLFLAATALPVRAERLPIDHVYASFEPPPGFKALTQDEELKAFGNLEATRKVLGNADRSMTIAYGRAIQPTRIQPIPADPTEMQWTQLAADLVRDGATPTVLAHDRVRHDGHDYLLVEFSTPASPSGRHHLALVEPGNGFGLYVLVDARTRKAITSARAELSASLASVRISSIDPDEPYVSDLPSPVADPVRP